MPVILFPVVPQGRPIIAQPFKAGYAAKKVASPVGTTEKWPRNCSVESNM
jgi:hypothetical protein